MSSLPWFHYLFSLLFLLPAFQRQLEIVAIVACGRLKSLPKVAFELSGDVRFLTSSLFRFQVRATEDVAAHAEVLRGGEERAGPGGRAGQEGAPVQASGSLPYVYLTQFHRAYAVYHLHFLDRCPT